MLMLHNLKVSKQLCQPAYSDLISDSQVRVRKRKRDISNWKRNIAKRRRNEGKSYINSSAKEISCKVIKKGCGSNCRYKCKSAFIEQDWEKYFILSGRWVTSVSKDYF